MAAAQRLSGLDKPSVWAEFTPLAQACGAVNLGQGFPDWDPPGFAIDAATAAFSRPMCNAYTRTAGHPPLLTAIANQYSPRLGRRLSETENITVTVGATEALFLTFQTFVNPGDEVVLIEPFFDLYEAQAKMAGASIRYVPLRFSPDDGSWALSSNELRAALSSKTRILVLNTPQNPVGKVFTTNEMKEILDALSDFPSCTVISDEVYEHLTYGDHAHVPFASLSDEAFQRTVSLYSAGKTFSCTGWKVGWAIAPENLSKQLTQAQQWVVFSVPTPLQDAVAVALRKATEPYQGHQTYYSYLASEYSSKKTFLVEALRESGFNPVEPQGGFFVLANPDSRLDDSVLEDTSPGAFNRIIEESSILVDEETRALRDYNLARYYTVNGVAVIPPSAFYGPSNKALGANWLRFAFCKQLDTLNLASQRLKTLALR